ncbi:calcineurin-binding protein cabin-1-like [Oratosquilla oratoria]|uniref:calcineurin-binding protein cabin-1-like n=1 Tax=Oratosquilla oratoria TaxID=337810 RepID=UPI003F75A662
MKWLFAFVFHRSQNLEQVVNYYTEGQYQLVAELIVALFHETLPKPRPGVTWPSRQTQLAIMVDSHLKLGNLKDVMKWGSLALTESVETYRKTEGETQKDAWTNAVTKILDTMHTAVMDLKEGTMDDIIPEQRKSLTSTLIQILVMQLDEPASSDDIPFSTLSPWIIMHRVLVEEEKRNEEMKQKVEGQFPETNSSSNSSSQGSDDPVDKSTHNLETGSGETSSKEEDGKENQDDKEESKSSKEGTATLNPSTLFLVTAHEHLGKHSFCCQNEGKFLLYCMDVFLEELLRSLEEQHHQMLYQALEQTTFCLYSHPSKKSKHKHLKDHGVNQIPLSLDRGLQLYKYYLPKEIPEFQSSQIPSIADDVAALFKRLRPLLPQSRMEERKNCVGESAEDEKHEEHEQGQSASNVNPPILKDYYYLLGDYFFKNKEWESAVTYYKLDVISNPDRIDSWAPMALAPKAQLETELNSCDVLEDDKFFDQALQAVKCFQKALELDMYHSNLWVEFGGLVYMVHSHASRLLKQDLNPDISMEMFERLEKIKVDMLAQAQICFKRANEIMEEGWDDEELPDERWLHQYMLGKVAEKQGMNPDVILNHYIQAAKHLHDIHARYPHKINYNNPQENAVEALEMYYRVHAYILKYLHQRDGKSVDPSIIKLFNKVLNEVVRQPFALFQENNKRGKEVVEEKEVHKEKEIIEDKDDEDGDIIADPESLRDPLELTEADRINLKRPLDDAEEGEPPSKRGSAKVITPVIEEIITSAMDHSQEKEKGSEEKGSQDKGDETKKEGSKSVSGGNETDKEPPAKSSQEKDGDKQANEEKKDSDQEIEVVAEVNKKQCEELVTRCLIALKECLARFPQHYKSLYRLAHYYHLSKQHKDNSKARNYLLGCDYFQRVPYMPVNGLFHEKRIWPQNPKNCNLFHGVWRVPNDEIDRPGSFAAHMYRSVSLVLDVLPYLKDFYSILEIALALKNSPEKDKKYLRDNERELLCEHATQVGLQTMKDKYAVLFKGSSPVHGNRRLAFLIDVYRAFKQLSRHLPHTEDQLGKMLQDAYKAFKGGRIDGRVNIMREAEMFCSKNLNFVRRPAPPTPFVGFHNNPSMGPTPFYNTQARRGRPPGSGRYRGTRGRGVCYSSALGTGENLAVQHAYRTYENMLQVQAALNRKTCSEADAQKFRRQLQQYQEELLRYWQIPGVSQYFHTALQNASSGGAKLSPNQVTPSAILSTLRQQQQTSSAHFQGGSNLRPSLSALASKSKEHGISITSVSSKRPMKFSGSNPRPRLSVTVTPTKPGQPSVPRPLHSREDISVMPVQRSSAGPKELVSSSVSLTHLPKLPAGTTLSRPRDSSPKAGPSKPMQSSPVQGQTRITHPGQRLPYSPMKQKPVTPQSPLARSSQSTTSPGRGRPQLQGIQDYRAQIQNPNVSVVSLGKDMQQRHQQGLPRSITLTPASRTPGRGHNVAIRSRGSFSRGRPGGMDNTKTFTPAPRGMNPTQRGGGPRMTAQVRPLDPAQLMKLASGSAKPGNLTGMNMLARPRGETPRGRGQVRPPPGRPPQPQVPPNAPNNKQNADDIITLD